MVIVRTRPGKFGLRVAVALLAVVLLQACESWPRDPENTLEEAAGAILRVGATEAPPWLTRAGNAATGPEAELVTAFARTIDAQVEWHWAALDDNLHALQNYELAIVAGGLTGASPWEAHVGFTRPWLVEGDAERVLAVPAGENRTLVALERMIASRSGGTP